MTAKSIIIGAVEPPGGDPSYARRMIRHEELMRVVAPDGKTFIATCDPDRLAAHMKELSPQMRARTTTTGSASTAAGRTTRSRARPRAS
jgi:hypothetical protein